MAKDTKERILVAALEQYGLDFAIMEGKKSEEVLLCPRRGDKE